TLAFACGLSRTYPAKARVVLESQHSDSFGLKRPDSPKKKTNGAGFCLLTWPNALLGAGDAMTGTRSRSDEQHSRRGVIQIEGQQMRQIILSAVAAVALATPALAADMKVKAVAPPVAPYNPWDVAFGGGITWDYIFRGITQSNHKPSVNAYFEPRYNVTKDLQY